MSSICCKKLRLGDLKPFLRHHDIDIRPKADFDNNYINKKHDEDNSNTVSEATDEIMNREQRGGA